MDSIPFNINNYVSVRLTEEGLDQYHRHFQLFGVSVEEPLTDSDGWSRFLLWELMSIFGERMGNGMPNLFSTEIRLHPRE